MIKHPTATVTVNGLARRFFEIHTRHGAEVGVGQCSIMLPRPLDPDVALDANVVVTASNHGEPSATIFQGRVRHDVDRQMNESDATATIRCAGNLWRMALPSTIDYVWAGPITPRNVLRSLYTLNGLSRFLVDDFVSAADGLPLLLGGVPWFEHGYVICPTGTSPLGFADRICRLFGYRQLDLPDGSIRVMRLCGPPTAADYTLTQGVDFLTAGQTASLDALVTYYTVDGASGTDVAGSEWRIVSTPASSSGSPFVPAPPVDVASGYADHLLVTQHLANASRVANEYDHGGPEYRVRGEVVGKAHGSVNVVPHQTFTVDAVLAGVTPPETFWQTSVGQDFTPSGYTMTLEGWRPTGAPQPSAPPTIPPLPPIGTATEDPATDPIPNPLDPAAVDDSPPPAARPGNPDRRCATGPSNIGLVGNLGTVYGCGDAVDAVYTFPTNPNAAAWTYVHVHASIDRNPGTGGVGILGAAGTSQWGGQGARVVTFSGTGVFTPGNWTLRFVGGVTCTDDHKVTSVCVEVSDSPTPTV